MKYALLITVCLFFFQARASSEKVLYFDKAAIAQSLAHQQPLAESNKYKIIIAEHDTPGQAEIHTHDADIIYCFEGEAEFITGGKMIDGKETAPNELRGTSILGGESRTIKGGDILYIPPGVPHWFKTVRSAFKYSVVKIK